MAAQLRNAANALCRIGLNSRQTRRGTTRLPRRVAEQPYCEPSLRCVVTVTVVFEVHVFVETNRVLG